MLPGASPSRLAPVAVVIPPGSPGAGTASPVLAQPATMNRTKIVRTIAERNLGRLPARERRFRARMIAGFDGTDMFCNLPTPMLWRGPRGFPGGVVPLAAAA